MNKEKFSPDVPASEFELRKQQNDIYKNMNVTVREEDRPTPPVAPLEKWTEEFDKKFKPSENSDICVVWNEDNTPLVWRSSTKSIKKELVDFLRQTIAETRAEVLREAREYALGKREDAHLMYEKGYLQALREVEEGIAEKEHNLGAMSKTDHDAIQQTYGARVSYETVRALIHKLKGE